MKLPSWLRPSTAGEIAAIDRRRAQYTAWPDEKLRAHFHDTAGLAEAIAIVAVVAARKLELEMFDVQLQGALALARGKIVEMQTGEGKTLACTPAVAWYARSHGGVHVMTVNDYLARRDARWMGPIYETLGLSVGCVQQTMGPAERRAAYLCDITYATANEIGFDFLRDQIALHPDEQVHRPFHAAVIDEADSILIDEARIPLVLAGGAMDEEALARRVDPIVRRFRRDTHFTLDEFGRNIALADEGIRILERALACGNLYAESNLALYSAVHNAIHAHFLLRRDVDYVVKNGAIESVDQFKGRIAQDRRWPAGLHTAIEAKEGVPFRRQGRVLGSMTLQNLVALYPQICGMTGTAATQAEEFRQCYNLDVEVIPTNRPVIRTDHPDVIFPTKAAKEAAVVEVIESAHSAGQPVLVGTASVEESERLSRSFGHITHAVLNARNEEEEAGIVARAGRQGDPGESRFLISFEDDLLVQYGIENAQYRGDVEGIQRLVEGQNLDIRRFLAKYESVIEGQRQRIQERRQSVLTSDLPEPERSVTLTAIDDLWADHLAAVSELRSGLQWYSYTGRDPLHEYLTRVDTLYRQLEDGLDAEVAVRLEEAQAKGSGRLERGATWTYLTTDQPFGDGTQRILRGLIRKVQTRSLWG
jgi:preprotein translocase subunit SecA